MLRAHVAGTMLTKNRWSVVIVWPFAEKCSRARPKAMQNG